MFLKRARVIILVKLMFSLGSSTGVTQSWHAAEAESGLVSERTSSSGAAERSRSVIPCESTHLRLHTAVWRVRGHGRQRSLATDELASFVRVSFDSAVNSCSDKCFQQITTCFNDFFSGIYKISA